MRLRRIENVWCMTPPRLREHNPTLRILYWHLGAHDQIASNLVSQEAAVTNSSAKLNFPFIQPSQAQKHVTYNTAMERLDFTVQTSVLGLEETDPPAAPQDGDMYGLGAAVTGAWAGHPGDLAQWTNDNWSFLSPFEGMRVWNEADSSLYAYNTNAWINLIGHQGLDGVGVNSSSDLTNRLSVSAPATLLSHEGSDHQLKINKASSSDTASLLFQSNWSGRAEMGLAGNDSFAIKVSADGSGWETAVSLDGTTGKTTLKEVQASHFSGQGIQSTAMDVTPGRLMRADFGYCPANVVGTATESGGVPTGAVIEKGTNSDGDFVKLADGTLMCSALLSASASTHVWTFPSPFAGVNASVSAVGRSSSQPIIVTEGEDLSATSVTFHTWSSSGSPLAASVFVSAVGRWY